MNPIGYNYYLASRTARLAAKSPSGPVPERSIIDTASHNHDAALGILLMTMVTAVPILLTGIFLFVFRF